MDLTDEKSAREYLACVRWPDGVRCPHCGLEGVTVLNARIYQCGACRAQFSVTVGTVFQDSKVPLHKWLRAIQLMCSSERGVTAVQILHDPGFGSYRTAWALCHRIRWATQQKPLAGLIRRTGDEPEKSARRPLRVRLPFELTLRGLLQVQPLPRDKSKGDRKTGAMMRRRPRSE